MSSWDWDTGYDLWDPKHPGYAGRAAEASDYLRKRDRENPPSEPSLATAHAVASDEGESDGR